MRRIMVAVIVALVIGALATGSAFGVDITSFNMVCSQSVVDNDCPAGARAHVDIRTTVTDNPMLLFVICFGTIVGWMLAYGRGTGHFASWASITVRRSVPLSRIDPPWGCTGCNRGIPLNHISAIH